MEGVFGRAEVFVELRGGDGMMLVVYHPEPGSESADQLALLASMNSPAIDDVAGSR